MLLQTNSYVVPKEKRAEHARLMRRFRQALGKLGCDLFEVYEQVGANWGSGETNGRYVQIMRFRDRKHQLAVQNAERNDPTAQALIAEFCELVNFPYQQQQGFFAVGFYNSVLPVAPARTEPNGDAGAEESAGEDAALDAADEGADEAVEEQEGETPTLPGAEHAVETPQDPHGEVAEEPPAQTHEPLAEQHQAGEMVSGELALNEPTMGASTNGEHFVEEEPLSEEELLGEISGHGGLLETEHEHVEHVEHAEAEHGGDSEPAAAAEEPLESPPAEVTPPERASLFRRRSAT